MSMHVVSNVLPWLRQGMQPNRSGYERLKESGVTHILTTNHENPFVADAQEVFGEGNVLHIKWWDDFSAKPVEDFQTIKTWREIMPEDAVIYCHCGAGINRATVGSIFLMMMAGITGNDAFDLIRHVRPIATGWLVPNYKASLIFAAHELLARDEPNVA